MCCVQLVRQAAHASARERVVDKLDHLAECIGNYRLAVVRPDSYMAVIGNRQSAIGWPGLLWCKLAAQCREVLHEPAAQF